MAKTKDKEKTQGFEDSLRALEQIVAQLESGELPLERSLALFEEGITLSRRCQTQLEEAERKVEFLLRERGEVKTVPYDAKSESGTRGDGELATWREGGNGTRFSSSSASSSTLAQSRFASPPDIALGVGDNEDEADDELENDDDELSANGAVPF